MPNATLSPEETRLLNTVLAEKLTSDDSRTVKEAVDAINDFTRTTMREEGFARIILPPLPITNDELDRQTWTDKPVKVVDKEPGSPAAISVPFGTLPLNQYIRGDKYPVMFERILTPRFTKDTDELRTYNMDIRQILSDNSIKDMMQEEDRKLIAACDAAMGGAAGTVVATSGTMQWVEIDGGITRDSLWDSLKVLPSTPSKLEVHTVLTNHITIKDVAKMGRTEQGGDFAQDVMKQGWTAGEYVGCRWVVTIKRALVPNGTMYHFADPKFLGKHFELVPTTMFVKREAFMLEFFCYETNGATIGNTSAVARVDFV